jgi:hypothetical protein
MPLCPGRSPFVVRRYEESIEVRADDPQPEAFVWRGRLYVVRAVLDHWQERRAWWREAREGTDVLTDARERQVWRVEASPGRLAGVGVYDLGAVADGVEGERSWRLLRVAD